MGPQSVQCRLKADTVFTGHGSGGKFAPMRKPLVRKLSDEFGDYLLVLKCIKCQHERTTEPVALAKIVGWDATLESLGKRLRCAACNAKEVEFAVQRRPRPRGRDWR